MAGDGGAGTNTDAASSLPVVLAFVSGATLGFWAYKAGNSNATIEERVTATQEAAPLLLQAGASSPCERHSGSCMCGAVKFYVSAPSVLVLSMSRSTVPRQSCGQYAQCTVPTDAVAIISGKEAVQVYVSNRRGWRYGIHFCRNCGTQLFNGIPSLPDRTNVNVDTLSTSKIAKMYFSASDKDGLVPFGCNIDINEDDGSSFFEGEEGDGSNTQEDVLQHFEWQGFDDDGASEGSGTRFDKGGSNGYFEEETDTNTTHLSSRYEGVTDESNSDLNTSADPNAFSFFDQTEPQHSFEVPVPSSFQLHEDRSPDMLADLEGVNHSYDSSSSGFDLPHPLPDVNPVVTLSSDPELQPQKDRMQKYLKQHVQQGTGGVSK